MIASAASHVLRPTRRAEIDAAVTLLEVGTFDPELVIQDLIAWGDAMADDPMLSSMTGFPFLRLWLRAGGLRAMVRREFGEPVSWTEEAEGRGRVGVFPVGVVGCWPAGNVEIQPFLTLACALLGGNACVLRVPSGLVEQVDRGLAALKSGTGIGAIARRVVALSIDREASELHQALAARCDGAMIWGGHDAVMAVRSLPFPPHARISVFGPRYSIGAVTRDAWTSSPKAAQALAERIARDVWPFEQQACSSPQTIYVERDEGPVSQVGETGIEPFLGHLQRAFEREAELHPRASLAPSLTASIMADRADWLFAGEGRRALFPATPDWTILYGRNVRSPVTRGGRVITLIAVDAVEESLDEIGKDVQTLGLACVDKDRELAIAAAAAGRGCDRVVPFGRMHVFDTPWDGLPLISPLTRRVRQLYQSVATVERSA